jgi:hypothetical protein
MNADVMIMSESDVMVSATAPTALKQATVCTCCTLLLATNQQSTLTPLRSAKAQAKESIKAFGNSQSKAINVSLSLTD